MPKNEGTKAADKDTAKAFVTGVHTCCGTYFRKNKGYPPVAKMPCARLRRTFHNQDISTWSMLKDPKLCPVLRDHGAVVVGPDGVLVQDFSCK
jgi:hypothetical protein